MAKIEGVDSYEAKAGTRWRAWYALDGRRKSRSFLTQAGAARFRRNYERLGAERALQIDAGRHDVATTVSTALDRWLLTLTRPSTSTKHAYRLTAERSWVPEFGDIPVSALTRDDVTAWVNRRIAERGAPATIQQELGRLISVMADCQRRGEIDSNPAQGIQFSKSDTVKRPKVITHDEFYRLLEQVPARHKVMVQTIGETGIRWGEAIGLPWRNIDLDTATMSITQAFKVGSKGKPSQYIGPPKTPASVRTFGLQPETVIALRNHYAVMEHTGPDDLVFPGVGSTTDKPVGVRHRGFILNAWRPAVERAGVPDYCKPHTLRHSHISWLLAGGMPTYLVTRKVGHETTVITEKYYAHWITDLRAQTDAYEAAMTARRQPPSLGS